MSGPPVSLAEVAEVADVAVVGGGPAGLAAATELRRLGVARVVVLDREQAAGGVPRHSDHLGYGLRDLGRILSGPDYARRWVERAQGCGVDVRPGSTVTSLEAGVLEVTSAAGRYPLAASAIVLATGCRERSRAARLIPGDRPAGVYTTGWLQQLVHLEHRSPGRRAVVVGAEHVSHSAVLTLAHGGCATVAMVTDQPAHTTFAALHAATRGRQRFAMHTSSRVVAINGHRRVSSVDVVGPDGGRTRILCDTVVLTGDWVPDQELARRSGVPLDELARGPVVDAGLRTALPGVFAAGNLVHAAEPADVCSLEGRHVARSVLAHLLGAPWPSSRVRVLADPPLTWVEPQRLSDSASPARGRLLLRTAEPLRLAVVEVRQGPDLLWSGRLARGVPERSMSISASWVGAIRAEGPDVRITVRGSGR